MHLPVPVARPPSSLGPRGCSRSGASRCLRASREGLPGSRALAGPGSEGNEAGSRRGLGPEWRQGAAGDGSSRGRHPVELSVAARGPGTPIPPAPLPPPATRGLPSGDAGTRDSGRRAGSRIGGRGLPLRCRPRLPASRAPPWTRCDGRGRGAELQPQGRAGAEAKVTDRAPLRLRPSAVPNPGLLCLSSPAPRLPGLPRLGRSPRLPGPAYAPPETPPGFLLGSSLLAGNFLCWFFKNSSFLPSKSGRNAVWKITSSQNKG